MDFWDLIRGFGGVIWIMRMNMMKSRRTGTIGLQFRRLGYLTGIPRMYIFITSNSSLFICPLNAKSPLPHVVLDGQTGML
jgi:hypothetical protein